MKTLGEPRRTAWGVMLGLCFAGLFVHGDLSAQPRGAESATASEPRQAASASLSGQVKSGAGDIPFQGAEVEILELGISVSTGRDGRYRFPALPSGKYTAVLRYLGAPEQATSVTLASGERATQNFQIGDASREIESVLVYGQLAGQAAALNRQRSADNLRSVVSADAIGQFPDQNAAEAARRVPGVSVANDQGEGRFAIIRGIDPELSSTTVNGIRVPGPEDDSRQVNLDVISVDLLESLEVVKSVTPDMDGDTIGGNIELTTVTAFDRGNSLRLRSDGSYSGKEEAFSPRVSASATRLFDIAGGRENFGVAASVSWFDRDFASDNVETAGWPELDAPGGGSVRGLEEAEQRDYTITRERLSASLSLDFRPDNQQSYYLRTLFSDFSDDELQVSNVFKFEEGDVESLDARSGLFNGAELEKLTEARKETQQIFSVVTGGEHLLNLWTVDYQAGYAFANEDNPNALGFSFVGEDLTLGYDLDRFGSRRPFLFGDDADVTDATRFALDEVVLEDQFTEEREWTLAFNVRRDMLLGGLNGYVKAGAKARLREKEADTNADVFDGFGGDFTVDDFTGSSLDFPFGTFDPQAGRGETRAFFSANRDNFERDEEGSTIDSQLEDYDLSEDVYAGYVMASVDVGAARIFGGVRVEHTDYQARGNEVLVDDANGLSVTPIRSGNRYTDVLPGVHLRYEPTARSVLRASYTQTLARPGFEAAAPRAEIEVEEDEPGVFVREAEVGNPDLDPLRAQNIDLSIEFYPGDVSVLGAALFYKRLKDFFVVSDIAGSGAFVDFDEAIATVNGDSADLYGVEINAVHRLAGLPSPLDGILLSANYTFTDSEASLPFRDQDVTLPRQSKHIANVAFGYEKYGLSMRLAGSYRGRYLDEIEELDDPAFDRFVDNHLQFDLTSSYRLSERLSLHFNIINLTDEPFYAYFDRPRFNSQYEEYGRTFEFGVGVNF